jgi:hypothetical protein
MSMIPIGIPAIYLKEESECSINDEANEYLE